jgi:hypothetical protein
MPTNQRFDTTKVQGYSMNDKPVLRISQEAVRVLLLQLEMIFLKKISGNDLSV